mmetsp:Transcript_115425/g.203810  ORF Transcript_115425/g.203810 Transcript_115425/m.203810 type:complete len:232 (-) Transcript_115425:3-698(-)
MILILNDLKLALELENFLALHLCLMFVLIETCLGLLLCSYHRILACTSQRVTKSSKFLIGSLTLTDAFLSFPSEQCTHLSQNDEKQAALILKRRLTSVAHDADLGVLYLTAKLPQSFLCMSAIIGQTSSLHTWECLGQDAQSAQRRCQRKCWCLVPPRKPAVEVQLQRCHRPRRLRSDFLRQGSALIVVGREAQIGSIQEDVASIVRVLSHGRANSAHDGKQAIATEGMLS